MFARIATILVIGFWLIMNTLLVVREVEIRRQGQQQRGVESFLRGELSRSRWLGIFRESNGVRKKVGYSGFTIEKTYDDPGLVYIVSVDTAVRDFLPAINFLPDALTRGNHLSVRGSLELDHEMHPLSLDLRLTLGLLGADRPNQGMRFRVVGKRDGESFRVAVRQGDEVKIELPVAVDSLALSDGLVPVLPLAELREGDVHRVRVFNPLMPLMGDGVAEVRVVSESTREIFGTLSDVFEIETRWGHRTIRSVVTPDGEIVRQELGPPLGLILEHANDERDAKRGTER